MHFSALPTRESRQGNGLTIPAQPSDECQTFHGRKDYRLQIKTFTTWYVNMLRNTHLYLYSTNFQITTYQLYCKIQIRVSQFWVCFFLRATNITHSYPSFSGQLHKYNYDLLSPEKNNLKIMSSNDLCQKYTHAVSLKDIWQNHIH